MCVESEVLYIHMGKQGQSHKGTNPYDIFIIFLTLLSLTNIFLYYLAQEEVILYVISAIDGIISFFFLIDFIRNIVKADSKKRYFFKEYGWADFLASLPLPQFKILRIFRLIKAYHLIRIAGGREIIRDFIKNRASGALYLILFLIIVLLEFGSIAVLKAEGGNPNANITSSSDALWWVYVTITTVGYGDRYPTTGVGRLVGMVVMLVGVGLFAVVTGFLANKFLPTESDSSEGVVTPDDINKIHQELQEIKELIKDKK